MSTLDLIARLRELGVRLGVEGDELLVDAPQGVITPELATQIRERKVQILALLRWSARSSRLVDLPLIPANSRAALPLSYAQQRLWFLDQLEPGSAAYNISWTVRLKGELNVSALQQAIDALVQRHEVLRCSFATVAGEARLIIHDSVAVPLEHSELAGASDERLRAHLSRLAGSNFDLAAAPLCRVFLVKRSATEHVLLVLIHHIISDGASMRILFRELAGLYDAAVVGDVAAGIAGLAPLDIQYADFAAWQRQWLSGEQLEQQLRYWIEKLTGAPPVLALPTDRPRSAALRFRGASVIRVLPQRLAEDLRALGRSNGATLFMVMFAVFDVLLYRYSGQSDLLVGTPISGRSRTALEGLIGFFVNTAVLRTQLTDDMSFRELLRQVRNTALEAHTYQELPFEKLVEVLQPERELSHTPVFQVMFDLQEEPRWELPVQNLEVIPEVIFSSRTSTFDLTLSVREAVNGLDAMFEYDTDLFDEATIEQFAAHYQNLLIAILQKPDAPLSELRLLGNGEPGAVLAAPVPASTEDKNLHGLFADAVQRAPEAVAVTDTAGTCLTYAALNARAKAIATALLAAGIAPGERIGICAARSADNVAAILGVLQAGACWLPLDPEYPASRLATMLALGGVSGVLTDGSIELKTDTTVWHLDAISNSTSDGLPALPNVPVNAAACVLFTSGSTGTPKAVVLEHRGLSFYAQHLAQATAVNSDSRVLQFASLSFDISLEEIFVAFAGGATLVLRAPGPAPSLAEFAAFCTANDVSWLSLPTAYWHEWAATLDGPGSPLWSALCTVIIGGEKALLPNWRRWQQAVGSSVQLLNTYGPTEASIAAAWFDLTHQNPEALHDIPIGRPLPGVQLAILDTNLRPQPIGVPGDLCIGGVGLARGYFGQTSAAFFEQKISSSAPGIDAVRWYRTGDRARLLAEGTIQYLGRADEQIKLRGHRVEPAETAAVLLQHPQVDNAVVMARAVAGDNVALVAWYAAQHDIDAADLKQFLQARLPDYMVPDFYVALPALPLTKNGKVDREALPAPDLAGIVESYRPPTTTAELQMAAIWIEVLGVPQVGLDDNFFALGGHSLLATRVVARVRDQFARDVPLRLLFNNPSIGGLLGAMETLQEQSVAPLTPRRKTTDLPPLSFAQQRLWLLDQLQPGNSAFNLPWLVRLRGMLDVAALQLALNALVARHDSLRTRFAASAGEPVQIIAPTQQLPLTQHHAYGLSEAQLQVQLRERIARSFDLQQGPLIRADLWELRRDDHVLLLCMQHIVSDGWSMGVIYRELSVLYAHYCAEPATPHPLPGLTVQYADYALWQREWLAGLKFPQHLNYWHEQLADAPPLLALCTDYPRPPVQSYAGDWVDLELPKVLSEQLTALAAAQGCSVFMLLLAGFKVLLARYAGADDIVVGTPVAGRQWTELETQVGFFLNTLVLRSDLSGNPRFTDLLQAVRKTALDAFEHQDVPFEKLIEVLQPERNPAYSPLVQVLFNLHNEPHTRPVFPGLTVDGFSLASGTAKFDLNVAVYERDSGLLIGIEYSSDLFAATTVQRMLQEYQVLLEAIVASPEQTLVQLPLPGGVFRLTALPPAATSPHPPLSDRVLQRIREQGDSIACEALNQRFTYSQLGYCATYLAASLPEQSQPVGLMLNHDALTVVAIASLTLINRTWVPLDPQLPLARLQAIAMDAGVTCIVAAEGHVPLALQVAAQQALIVLPADPAAWGYTQPEAAAADDNGLAYILYTSGTSGKPKGVPQTRANVAAHMDAYAAALELTPGDRLSLLAAYGFDAAIMDIYAGLLTGACICPVDVRAATAPLANLQALNISVLHATPTVFRLLLEEGGALKTVRVVVLGGEEMTAADFALFRRRFMAGTRFVNGLGPSESTTALQFFADTYSTLPPGVVPIGRPVRDTQVELRDAHGIPSALCGELIIRSHRLAPGYWQNPAATAAAFIDAVTYRSGDIARYLPDGNLVFDGRADGQIKLRGQRIETAEIEQHLDALPAVRRSVVRLWSDGDHDYLVAWYQPKAKISEVTEAQLLRAALRDVLPESMLPAAFVAVSAFPLTPNGKLDIGALPAPDMQQRQAYRAPDSTLSRQLADIWQTVLGIETVGLDDDFFALGGHSLIATRMLARVRDQLQTRVPLAEIFAHPVLEAFAKAVADFGEDHSVPLVARRAEDRALAPLSWSQQRLWFLDQLEPQSTAYTLHRGTRFKGVLDRERLQHALNSLVLRHESLRTVFASQSGDPVQMVLPDQPVVLQTAALPGATDEVLQTRLLDEVRRPFDLQRGPLLRASLLQMATDDAVLLISMHHIISDGWSMGVLCEELTELYHSNDHAALARLPIQYVDYALWQRDWLSGAELKNQLSYWRKQLHEVPPVLELPYDHPRPVVPSYRGAWAQRRLPLELTASLQVLARSTNSTLYMELLTAFNVVLARYSGREDLVVGTPVAGRQRSELESLIGFFLNTLVMRNDLSGNPDLRSLLLRVRATALGAYQHQDVPFEKLLEELQPARSLSTAPLVQIMFNLHNEFDRPLALTDDSYGFHLDRGTAKFDLNLAVAEGNAGLLLAMEYSTDLFNAETVGSMLAMLEQVLQQMTTDSSLRLSELPFAAMPAPVSIPLPPALPEVDTVVALFDAQLAELASRPAVQAGELQWSYAELAARANAVAHNILAAVEPSGAQQVGLLLGHDAPMLAGLLGALKSGKTYVPLDPDSPVERLQTILTSAGVGVIVAAAQHAELAGALSAELPLVLVAADAVQDPGPPALLPGANDLAYILFTSGTTGTPKGVMQTHANVLHHAQTYRNALGIDSSDRLSLLSPFGFDAAVMDIYASLISGACLCPFDLKNEAYLGAVIEQIAASGITLLHATPTVYRYLMRHKICRHDVTEVRAVVLGGEAAKTGDFEFFKNNFKPHTLFVNGLGPSECTLALQWFADQKTMLQGGLVPTGKPVPGVDVLLLDDQLRKSGICGELAIACAQITPGYWQQPELTAKVFVEMDGRRWYRTGDTARYLPDGNLLFTGRIDEQIKLRGHRIEPAEIEGQLTAHERVDRAVVALRTDLQNNPRLVAWVVAKKRETVEVAELREHLQRRLPRYMVPSAVLVLDNLPLTSNGKVDRRALPTPKWGRNDEQAYVAPRNKLEARLAAIWADVLGVEKVGVDDDFFELGGHSLLAMQLMARTTESLQVGLPLRRLFDGPTIAQVAQSIDDVRWTLNGDTEPQST